LKPRSKPVPGSEEEPSPGGGEEEKPRTAKSDPFGAARGSGDAEESKQNAPWKKKDLSGIKEDDGDEKEGEEDDDSPKRSSKKEEEGKARSGDKDEGAAKSTGKWEPPSARKRREEEERDDRDRRRDDRPARKEEKKTDSALDDDGFETVGKPTSSGGEKKGGYVPPHVRKAQEEEKKKEEEKARKKAEEEKRKREEEKRKREEEQAKEEEERRKKREQKERKEQAKLEGKAALASKAPKKSKELEGLSEDKLATFAERCAEAIADASADIKALVKEVPSLLSESELDTVFPASRLCSALLGFCRRKTEEEVLGVVQRFAPLLNCLTTQTEKHRFKVKVLCEVQRLAYVMGLPRLSPASALLEVFFDALYRAEVIEEQYFQFWAVTDDDTPGKTSAMFQITPFLDWLNNGKYEGEESDSEEEEDREGKEGEDSDESEDEDGDIEANVPQRSAARLAR